MFVISGASAAEPDRVSAGVGKLVERFATEVRPALLPKHVARTIFRQTRLRARKTRWSTGLYHAVGWFGC